MVLVLADGLDDPHAAISPPHAMRSAIRLSMDRFVRRGG